MRYGMKSYQLSENDKKTILPPKGPNTAPIPYQLDINIPLYHL